MSTKSTNYSEKVLDHFKNPRNVGVLEGDNVASGRVGNPTCGDIMEIYIKVKDNIIDDIKFKTFGCGSAVATSSMVTTMVKGMTLEEALKVSRQDVANELDGLPPIKMHCSNLAADALHEAIKNYWDARGIKGVPIPETHSVLIDDKGAEPDSKPTEAIKGELEFLGNGVAYTVPDYTKYKDQRVLIIFTGTQSIVDALELTKQTGRVVLAVVDKKIPDKIDAALRKSLTQSDVKILTQSKLLEIGGEGEVEHVTLLNLDENEQFNLFVDAVIIPQNITVPTSCSVDEIPQ